MSSADRTVTVPIPDEDIGQVLSWPNKNPGDQLQFSVDYTAWLADAYPGQSVGLATAGAQVTMGDDALGLIGPVVITGGVVSMIIAAGTAGVLYGIQVVAQTATTTPQTKAVVVTLGINGGQAIPAAGTSQVIVAVPPAGMVYSDGTTLGSADLVGASYADGTFTVTGTGGVTIGQVNAAVAVETARAEAAESSLAGSFTGLATTTALAAETTRAEAAEASLAGSFTGLATTTALAAEVTRAEAAESSIQGSVTANHAAITAEVTRAEAAEASISAVANAAIPLSQKAAANGVAPLDGTAKVPFANLPAGIGGGLTYLGTWNAATNTPTITSSTAPTGGVVGTFYVVGVAGTTTINGVSNWGAGDWIIWNGVIWDKLDGQANPVTSVAGRQGAVVLSAGDISGLTAPATAPFGTVAGTVADGGSLATETTRAEAAETSLQGSINALATAAHPVILHGYSGDGTLASNGTCMQFAPPSAPTSYSYTFTTNCLAIKVEAAPTSNATLTLLNNGTGVGTVVIPASSTTPTVTIASGFTVAGGNICRLQGPATADATLGKITSTLEGTR